jgi:protein dithiol oxidoreductase (disulfide-forming)
MLKFTWRNLGLLVLSILLAGCGKMHNDTKAATPTDFQAGKDYQVIAHSQIMPLATPKSVVEVKEFFSYACPACYRFEPVLQKWLTKKPSYIKFERIPLIFQPGWRNLARAYYIAKMLGVEKQLTPAIFKAIHVEGQNLSEPKLLEALFVKLGVKQQEFENMASFSPGIDAQLLRGDTLAQEDQIMAAPTLVIDNRYKVDPSLVGGDPARFLQVVDYLIEKVRKGEA